MKYSVKLIIRYSVEDDGTFFEESIVMFDANSFDDAYEKADRYIRDNELTVAYRNIEGKTVTRQVKAVDCFSVTEGDDGVEVYSRFLRSNHLTSDNLFPDFLSDSCTAEELTSLRHW